MNIFKVLLFGLLLLCSPALALDNLTGTYEGTMALWEPARTVPLKMTLSMVESPDPVNGQMLVIVGAFTIDDEGGPYNFSKVTFDINDGSLDMRYTRPNHERVLNTPVHLRFIGRLDDSNGTTVSGRVLSGFQGPIGEFSVRHVGAQTTLSSVSKYEGVWAGRANFSTGSGRCRITLAPSISQVSNPEHLELDFTNSKIGSFNYEGVEFPFTRVFIDYLRGTVIMVSGGNSPGEGSLTLESSIDANGVLSGQFISTYRGQNGSYTARRIR